MLCKKGKEGREEKKVLRARRWEPEILEHPTAAGQG